MELENQTRRRIRREEEMYPIVETWLQSGQSQKQFCEEQGIKMHLLNYWVRHYRDQRDVESSSPVQEFIPVDLKEGNELNSVVELIYPNGIRLRFGQGVSLSTLQALLPK